MQRLFAMPAGRLAKADPEERDWYHKTHELIAAYFAGDRLDEELADALRGYRSFRLMTLTPYGTEQWSLLMAALQLLDDGVAGVSPSPPLKRLSHGVVTYDEYVETCFPPKVEKKARHSW